MQLVTMLVLFKLALLILVMSDYFCYVTRVMQ